jgi:hypothetical protein
VDVGRFGALTAAARVAFVVVAWVFLLCAIVQVFLAGLGVFVGPAEFLRHRDFGYIIGWLPLAMLVLALVGSLPRPMWGASLLLVALFGLQSVLVAFRSTAPALSALHPLNGFLILYLAQAVARRSRRFVAPPIGTAG